MSEFEMVKELLEDYDVPDNIIHTIVMRMWDRTGTEHQPISLKLDGGEWRPIQLELFDDEC